MRSYHGKGLRALATSGDAGASFGALRLAPELNTPVCQGSMITLRDEGRQVLLFASPRGTRRDHLTVWRSDDGGDSWPVAREVYAGSAAYSNLVALPGGRVGLLFERDGYRKLDFVVFDLAWVAKDAGAPQSAR